MKQISDEQTDDLLMMFEVIRMFSINSWGCIRLREQYGVFMDTLKRDLDKQADECEKAVKRLAEKGLIFCPVHPAEPLCEFVVGQPRDCILCAEDRENK